MSDISKTADSRNSNLSFHPLADIFPLMEGTEFDELVADIKEHGLREPIVLYEDKTLDGRNRYRACIKAGVEPERTLFEGNDPAAFVTSKNLLRRHLTTAQRAAIAADIATMKSGERTDLAGNQARSQPEAAKLLKVSRDSVQRAAKVKKASPELHGQVKEGKVSLADAERAVGTADTKGRRQPAKKKAPKTKAERKRKARERREAERKRKEEEAVKQREIKETEAKAKATQLAADLKKANLDQRVLRYLTWEDDPTFLRDALRHLPAEEVTDSAAQPVAGERLSRKHDEGNGIDPEIAAETRKAEMAALDDSKLSTDGGGRA